ncbi:MAG TPA: hypothetical protein VLW51_02080 [Solirubrobacteraceae bacterium]|nr:hypothetical protein [Solirubrobacteraceae bacterium]
MEEALPSRPLAARSRVGAGSPRRARHELAGDGADAVVPVMHAHLQDCSAYAEEPAGLIGSQTKGRT